MAGDALPIRSDDWLGWMNSGLREVAEGKIRFPQVLDPESTNRGGWTWIEVAEDSTDRPEDFAPPSVLDNFNNMAERLAAQVTAASEDGGLDKLKGYTIENLDDLSKLVNGQHDEWIDGLPWYQKLARFIVNLFSCCFPSWQKGEDQAFNDVSAQIQALRGKVEEALAAVVEEDDIKEEEPVTDAQVKEAFQAFCSAPRADAEALNQVKAKLNDEAYQRLVGEFINERMARVGAEDNGLSAAEAFKGLDRLIGLADLRAMESVQAVIAESAEAGTTALLWAIGSARSPIHVLGQNYPTSTKEGQVSLKQKKHERYFGIDVNGVIFSRKGDKKWNESEGGNATLTDLTVKLDASVEKKEGWEQALANTVKITNKPNLSTLQMVVASQSFEAARETLAAKLH